MPYLVLFADGHVKAYADEAAANQCAKADGGQVVPLADPAPAAPAEAAPVVTP